MSRRLETGQRLARAGGVPDVATAFGLAPGLSDVGAVDFHSIRSVAAI